MNYVLEACALKNNTSVRKPSLAYSNTSRNNKNDLSVGDTLRKARRNLLIRRFLFGMLAVILVTAIVAVVVLGYADGFIDSFYAMMG